MADPRRHLLVRAFAVLSAVGLLAVLGAPATAAPDDAGNPTPFARISIESLTPDIVTTTSAPTVTVTGRVHNIGDRAIRDLTLRLERGDAVTAASGLRSSLAVEHPPVAAAGPFEPLTDELSPGDDTGFSVTMPLSAADGLRISRPGVYPVQINVNGVPDYGNTAQVAGSRTLLPVLSLPPDADRADAIPDPSQSPVDSAIPGLGPDGSVSADLSNPARLTLLWPLAAPPQLAPGVPGGNTEPVRLISEDMARSLDTGGRLDALLSALSGVVGEPDDEGAGSAGSSPAGSTPPDAAPADSSAQQSGDPSSDAQQPEDQPEAGDVGSSVPPETATLARSMCLAVDPDLLITVRAMSLGYVVSTNPADPDAPTTPGRGTDAAARWLSELRRVADQLCVVALPFAQADLTSLARVDNAGLDEAALQAPADIVDAILGVDSVRGLAIPALGALDARGATVLTDMQIGSAAVAASSVEPEDAATPAGRYRTGRLALQTYDSAITAAFAALGTAPATPAITPADETVDLAAESALSRRQAAIAALAYPAIGSGQEAGDADPTVGRAEFVMPSTYWSPTAEDAEALFATAGLLLQSGAATPAPLRAVAAGLPTTAAQARLVDPPGTDGTPAQLGSVLTPDVIAAMRRDAEVTWQLEGSFVQSADVAATPGRYMSPLREDLLRAIRAPDGTGEAVREYLVAAQRGRVSAVTSTLDEMRAAVTILDPGGRYTLASERSPLLLIVSNDLALPIRARISAATPSNLEVGDIGVIEIPASGTRQIQLPTQTDASEATTVSISLATVTGLALGEDISLSVHSNAYGRPLFVVTIIAAAALVLLTARRLWHRFRGEPDPADQDRPEPDELERLLAGSTYQERVRKLHDEEHPAGRDADDGFDPDDPRGGSAQRRPDEPT